MTAIKKPIKVEVLQWLGNNQEDINIFCGNRCYYDYVGDNNYKLKIRTLEGDHIATVGDFIIKGVQGEFYPCKEDIFHATYTLCND